MSTKNDRCTECGSKLVAGPFMSGMRRDTGQPFRLCLKCAVRAAHE